METTKQRAQIFESTNSYPRQSRPKRTVCTPTRDDDLLYTVGSYSTRKHFTEKAEVAQVGALDAPRHTQTMA